MSYINISGYKFINLVDLEDLQNNLKAQCQALELKGTILLSPGGINAFLSGTRLAIDSFYEYLPTTGLPTIAFKESTSIEAPFKFMRVKIKSEIVTMGVPDINVAQKPAPSIAPVVFKQWIEEGKEMIILDTRNDYEVQLGSFKNATHLNIKNFRSFPNAAKTLPPDYKNKTIVTFCTGGIRCEKAAPLLISEGFQDVYQLDGGILKYLEECGQSYFEGECFVFDKRIAIDGELQETNTVQCHGCRHPVSEQAQLSPHYIEGKSCPLCVGDKAC